MSVRPARAGIYNLEALKILTGFVQLFVCRVLPQRSALVLFLVLF